MTSIYTYSLSADFSNNINQYQFHKEVNDASIVPNLIGIHITDDVVDVEFDSALNASEQTTLNNLVSNHIPISTNDTVSSSTTTYSTTLTSYQTRDTLTTGFLDSGDYKIDWFYTFKSEDGYPDIRIIIDDTTVIHTNTTRTPVISGNLEYDKNGFDIQTFSQGQHTIKLQLKGKGNATTTIVKSCLFIMPV